MRLDNFHPYLNSIFDTAKISLWDWDVPAERLHFYSRLPCFGQDSPLDFDELEWENDIFHQDRPHLREIFNSCLNGKQDGYLHSFRMRAADGSWAWIQESGTVVQRDGNGRALRIMGTQQDVTQLKQMEERLEDLGNHMDIIADISGQSYWRWDVRRDELVFSRQFEKEFGYAPGELCQSRGGWVEIAFPEDRAMLQQAMVDYLAGETECYNVTVRIRHKDGRYVWVTTSGKAVEWQGGKPVRVAGGAINVDHIKSTEQALQAALRENEVIRKHMQLAYDRTASDLEHSQQDLHRQHTMLMVVNRVATRLLEAESSDFDATVIQCLRDMGEGALADRAYILQNKMERDGRGMSLLYQWARGDRPNWEAGHFFPYSMFADWREQLATGKPINRHVHSIPGETGAFFRKLGVQSILLLPIIIGEQFWGVLYFGDTHKIRLSDEAELGTLQSGGILTVLSVLRHQAMEQLTTAWQAAKASAQAKTMFLANMSHEMRTPMNAILGMTAMIRQNAGSLEAFLSEIDAAAKRLLHVIGNVLAMSNIELDRLELKQEPFLLQAVLDKVYSMQTEAALDKRQRFDFQSCNLPTLGGDATLLGQILNHILMNAVKFAPEGGCVGLAADGALNHEKNTADIIITVSDNGPGLDAGSAVRIFNAFEQQDNQLSREHEGAGLGLSIAKGIVAKMGGDIQLDTRPGEGCVFKIYLSFPLFAETGFPADTGLPASEEPGAAFDFSKCKALLVDDNEINRLVCRALLEEMEIDTEEAENGEQAVQMVRNAPDKYDVILMDIHMPVMDGYSAARAIRQLGVSATESLPIIAVTANAFDSDAQHSLQAGMNAHLSKPLEPELLWSTLRRFLGAKYANVAEE